MNYGDRSYVSGFKKRIILRDQYLRAFINQNYEI